MPTPVATATPYSWVIVSAPSHHATVTDTRSAARTRSVAIITGRRLTLSTHAPAGRPSTSTVMVVRALSSPTSPGPASRAVTASRGIATQPTWAWEAAIAPYWPRIMTLLEGEVLYRARLLAEGGLRRMLGDLDAAVTWEGETLRLPKTLCEGVRPLGGLGLLLVPSVFTWPRVFSITTPPWQPTIRYPPRGVATLWEHRESDPPQALAAVLGRTRARLLAELDQPASTRELATRLDLSEPGTNQHLTALRKAGLTSAHRTGRYVLYARTAIAEALIAGDASPLPSSHGNPRTEISVSDVGGDRLRDTADPVVAMQG